MNTAIYTQSMGSQGVGFAMPSNVIVDVYNMLIGPEHKVVRGSIGISFQGAEPPAVAREYGFANGGVVVGTVTPGRRRQGRHSTRRCHPLRRRQAHQGWGPAGRRHLRPQSGLHRATRPTSGTARSTPPTSSSATAASLSPTQQQRQRKCAPAQPDAGEGKLGITVSAIPSALASKLGVKGGVIVNSVRPGSFADEIDLARGAVITEINGIPSPTRRPTGPSSRPSSRVTTSPSWCARPTPPTEEPLVRRRHPPVTTARQRARLQELRPCLSFPPRSLWFTLHQLPPPFVYCNLANLRYTLISLSPRLG